MKPEKLSIGVLESCVDYIRLSIPTAAKDYSDWRDKWSDVETEFALDGAEPEAFSMRAYNFTGFGGVSHAVHNGRALLQAAGPIAHVITEDTKQVQFSGTATRADTKVTAGYAADSCREACWRLARQAKESQEKAGAPGVGFDLFQRTESGSTIYFERDNSASFARAYQAGIRHPDRYPENAMSFEIQHQKKTANQAWNILRSSSNLSLGAASLTVGRLESLGVSEFWRNEIPPNRAPQVKHRSTKEGTLKWVRSGIRGAFSRAGRENWECEFLVALGFDSLTDEQAERITDLLARRNPQSKLF